MAEVWEKFKRENYEELARDLEGMTDQNIADMEQEIMQYNCEFFLFFFCF